MLTKKISETMTAIKSPITGGPVVEIQGIQTMDFRKESYEVPVRFYKCVESGEEFTTGEQDEEWSSLLYAQYRQKHGIPSPAQIREIRERNGLALGELTAILGFGTNQLSQYEKGEVPSESNGKLLSLCLKKDNLRMLLRLSKEKFSKAEYRSLYDRINSINHQ